MLEYPESRSHIEQLETKAQEGLIYLHTSDFMLESGECFHGLKLSYSTYGELSARKDNVIWVCHALTANAHVLSWWGALFGKGKLYDTDKYFVICVNVPGSCYGSSGPLDVDTDRHKVYYNEFPRFTIRDVVKSFELLREYLGISEIHTCIGGSLGGQQAIEWGIMCPWLIKNLILLASNARTSPWGIALNETQRMAIRADPTWGQHHPEAGLEGMKVARAIALLSYRSYQAYLDTQSDHIEEIYNFKAISYQLHQGEKFSRRFNAYSYWYLTLLLDSHNVGRGRVSVEDALATITANTLIIGIDNDVLFPLVEQEFMAKHIPGAVFFTISSPFGHDGFLIESEKIIPLIQKFYDPENNFENQPI